VIPVWSIHIETVKLFVVSIAGPLVWIWPPLTWLAGPANSADPPCAVEKPVALPSVPTWFLPEASAAVLLPGF
jgi:hypothetical protein